MSGFTWTFNVSPNIPIYILWDPWNWNKFNHMFTVAPTSLNSNINGLPFSPWMGERKLCARKTGYLDVIIDLPAGIESSDHTFNITMIPDPAFSGVTGGGVIPDDPSNLRIGGGFKFYPQAGITNLYPNYIDAECYGEAPWMITDYPQDPICNTQPFHTENCPAWEYIPPSGYTILNSYRAGIGNGSPVNAVTLKKTGPVAAEGIVRKTYSGKVYTCQNGTWVLTPGANPTPIPSTLVSEVVITPSQVASGGSSQVWIYISNTSSTNYWGGNIGTLKANGVAIMDPIYLPEIPAGKKILFPEITFTPVSDDTYNICFDLSN